MKSGIVSILNLKNGVGCSCLAWNIAHTLQLNLYQHDKAMHHTYNAKRKETLEDDMESILPYMIQIHPIIKNRFDRGVYDLGSDFNYAHIKKIIGISEVIIIPCELGHETLVKTIATLRFISALETNAKIFVVINKLLPLSSFEREGRYTQDAKELIEEHSNVKVVFFYMRHSFFLFRYLDAGFFFLDNYIVQADIKINHKTRPSIKPFELLQHIKNISDIMKNKNIARKKLKMGKVNPENTFQSSIKTQPSADVIDSSLVFKNSRAIKDMFILTTDIKEVLGEVC